MNLFDVLNKLLGRPTTGEIRESRDRGDFARRQAERRRNPPAPVQPKKFVPTRNDPEYYARNGQAKNEAEAQRLVNAYRETQVPGIKPLFDNFAPKTQVTSSVEPVMPKPSITASFQPYNESDDRYKITTSRF